MALRSTPHPEAESAASYETSDVNIRAILWLALGIAIGVVIVSVGLWILLASLRAEAGRSQPVLSPLADTRQTPPAPRLQTAPIDDYQSFRQHEDKLLHSYAWIDRERNIVKVPIERAMELIAQRGEPTLSPQQSQPQDQKSEVGDPKSETSDRGAGIRGYQSWVLSTQYSALSTEPSADESPLTNSPLTNSLPTNSPRTNSPLTPRGLIQQVGLDQRLGEQIPLDLQFHDEQGQPVRLGQFCRKQPVILTLVYFRCPMLCTQVLNGVLRTSQALQLSIGTDYDIVSVSIDPRETPAMAAAKKEQYVSRYRRAGAKEGWHFLTGDQAAIDELARAVGYRYQYDSRSDQYAHPSGIIVLTPEGRVSRYFYGIDYSPGDLRLGLVESSQGRIGTPVDQILLLCFHYDPATGKYGLVIARVIQLAETATMLALGIFLWVMFRLERRRSAAVAAAEGRPSLVSEAPQT